MANSDKDILITPNTGQSAKPKIEVTGANNATKTITINDDGTLSFDSTIAATSGSVANGDANLVTGDAVFDYIAAQNQVDGSGTANQIPLWSDSDTLTDSKLKQTNAGVTLESTFGATFKVKATDGNEAFLLFNNSSNHGMGLRHATSGNELGIYKIGEGNNVRAKFTTSGFTLHDTSNVEVFDIDTSGVVTINQAYTLPTTVTGANNRVLTAQTDGSTAWAAPTFREITAGGNTLASSETLAFTAGSNVTITESGGAVTIASTDTNTNTQLSNEQVQDIVGAMFSSNTETGIAATYQDGDGTIDLVVGTLNQDTTGNAATVTVSDSTANTNFPVVFHDESNGLLDDTGALRYNPSTGTLLVPNLNVAGTTTQVNTVTMEAANAVVFEGATSDAHETTLTITDPTADRTIVLPDASGTISLTDTNTFRTITAGGNTLGATETLAFTAGSNITISESGGAVTITAAASTGASEAFKTIAVSGQDNIVADAAADTLTFAAGSNVTLTTNASSDTITIASSNAALSSEEVQDIVGAMFSSNTETRISATYQDGDGTIDLVVDDMTTDTNTNQLTTFTLTGDSGSNQTIAHGNTLDIAGGDGIATVVGSTDTVTVGLDIDGMTDINAALVDADLMIVDDGAGGTNRKATMSRLKTYMQNNLTFTTNTNTQLSTEQVQDIAGGMFSSNTETGITATYQDADGTIDLVVGTLNQDTTGNAATATALETARNIGGVSFDGTANINLPGVNTAGNQNTSGTAALATTVTVSNTSANTNFPVVFHNESNGLLDDTGALRYNPSTGTLLVPNLNVAGTTTTVNTVTMEAANAIVFEGATSDSNETTLTITDPTADRTITLPDATGTIALTSQLSDTQLSTEQVQDIVGAMFSSNTETRISATYQDGDGTIDLVVDDMTTDTNTNQLTTFTLTGDSGSNQTIAHGNTLDIAGGTGIDTVVGATDTVTVAIDSTVATLTGSQTLTNKTLTAPSITGTTSTTGAIDISAQYGRINFKKDASGNATNQIIFFINGNDQYAGSINYNHAYNQMKFKANQSEQLYITDGAIYPPVDNDVDLGTSSLKFKDSFFGLVDAENFKVNGGQGSDGQILTSTGSGVAWEDAAAGGATVIGGLTDVTMDITNYTDGILIQTNSDGSAPTTGTLNAADGNVGIGKSVLSAITSADANVVIGKNAGPAITSGGFNVLLGENAGSQISTGYSNIAIGRGANRYGNGNENIAIGTFSFMNADLTGERNIGIGYNAGNNITTGDGNVVIGNADVASATGDNQLSISSNSTSSPVTWITGNSSGVVNIPGSLTVAGSAVGGASTIGELTDVLMDATNFVDGLLIQTDSDGSAPTTGTLSSATGNLGLGKDVLSALTSGDYNITLGYDAGKSITTGSKNIFIGYQAGDGFDGESGLIGIGEGALGGTNQGGAYNVALGNFALTSATSATYNIGMGQSAGQQINTGHSNVLLGASAGYAITSGASNIAIGRNALDNADTESDNIAIGRDALGGAIDGGEKNISIGNYTGDAITEGDANVLIGHQAGTGITTGSYNVAIGYQAYDGTNTGSGNVAIGWWAGGDSANTGGEAVYIGRLAGYAVTSANHNVLIGMSAGRAITTSANNVIIGTHAGDAITGAGNTIIGTQAATSTSGGAAERNTILGNYAAGALTTGDTNIILGDYSGKNLTTGSHNVIIGGDVNAPSATADSQLLIASGNGGVTYLTSDSSGVVDFPNGLTNNGSAIESAFETITDVTIGSGTSGTTSGIYFGANNEAGVVAGEVSSASTANDGYIELMNMDLDAITGANGLQTIELTVQIEDETNEEVESFKALVQATEKTVLGSTVRAVNFTEWAILFDGAARIGTLAADYDSSDDTIRIRYQNKQGSTATLTATFYAITMQNNT